MTDDIFVCRALKYTHVADDHLKSQTIEVPAQSQRNEVAFRLTDIQSARCRTIEVPDACFGGRTMRRRRHCDASQRFEKFECNR